MIDSVKLHIHCPYGYNKQGDKIRIHNSMFYDIMLKNCNQKQNGFILNSRTGIYRTDN